MCEGDFRQVGPHAPGTAQFPRRGIAQEQGVPAYIVFSNATLLDMAAKRPGSMQELLEVSGVGHVKAERYGAAFLNEIRQFEHTNREES